MMIRKALDQLLAAARCFLIHPANAVQNQSYMQPVIEKPTIDLPAIQKIAAGETAFFLRRDVENAAAALSQILDSKHMGALKFAAQVLLQVQAVSHPEVWPKDGKLLNTALEQVAVLQDALQNQFDVLNRTGAAVVNPAVREANRVVLEGISKSFDYIESIRWNMLNAQAELDIQNGSMKSFGSINAALKFLDGIS